MIRPMRICPNVLRQHNVCPIKPNAPVAFASTRKNSVMANLIASMMNTPSFVVNQLLFNLIQFQLCGLIISIDFVIAANRTLLHECDMLNCSYACKPTPSGPKCYCNRGQKPNGMLCEDFDECSIEGICDQMCENTVGSYMCRCIDGYTSVNKTLCRAINGNSINRTLAHAVNR